MAWAAAVSTTVDVAASRDLGGGTVALVAGAVANSAFTTVHATLNRRTGALTFTTSVVDPGAFSWRATFQNGSFGAFAASARCKKGFVKLAGGCRPARIVFAKGSKTVARAGTVSITVKPSQQAAKALRSALRKGRGVPVSATLSFQSARGGRPVSHVLTLTVKLKR